MICKVCKKDLGNDNVPICEECFYKELMWEYRNDPNVTEDVRYKKNPDGSFEEIGVIKGLTFKEDALKRIKKRLEK